MLRLLHPPPPQTTNELPLGLGSPPGPWRAKWGMPPVQERPVNAPVGGIEEGDTVGELSVPAGSACLLIIVLEGTRKLIMHDQPDIGSVDAHAESVRRDHQRTVILHEILLYPVPLRRRKASVIGLRPTSHAGDSSADSFHPAPGSRIDEAGAGLARDQFKELAFLVCVAPSGHHGPEEVAPIEASHHLEGIRHPKACANVGAYGRSGGRGKRHDRGRQPPTHSPQIPIGRPKIVSPK